MGNLCGKESKPSPFDQPGRIVGSAPPPSTDSRAPVPKISSQGRPLGSSDGSQGASDARQAAAKAAEERAARANKATGKLGRNLASQKQSTRAGTLGEVSAEERRKREVDEAAQAQNYN
ncbi:MAG: hypothetical protein MMC33_007189 [Icmadophila ericetorum]|nr:hypothetical protein [Icmadophila ericetorum]